MKKFKGIDVRVASNGCGIDKFCPATKTWSVMFTSGLTRSDFAALWALFD